MFFCKGFEGRLQSCADGGQVGADLIVHASGLEPAAEA